MSHLAKIVRLFRALDNPEIKADFSLEIRNGTLNKIIINAIIDVWSIQRANDVSLELLIGKRTIEDSSSEEELTNCEGEPFTLLKVRLPRTGKLHIFLDIKDLLQRSDGINKGKFPTSFYLIKRDYFHGGTEAHKQPGDIAKIQHYCEFIQLLIKSGHFLDSHSRTKPNVVFVVNDEESKNTSPNKITLDFCEELLTEQDLDLTPLKEIFRVENNIHKEEKLATFRVAVWDSLAKTEKGTSSLLYIVKNYEKIVENYKLNYELYIRGFSFSKFINEVNEFSHDLIQKTHALVGDIVTKTLAVPALFTTWLYVLRIKDKDPLFVIGLFLSLLFTAIVLIFVIENQQYLIGRLANSSENTLKKFTKKLNYTNELGVEDKSYIAEYVSKIETQIAARILSTKRRLITLRTLVWTFVLATFYITVLYCWDYSISALWLLGSSTLLVASISVFTLLRQSKSN